MRYHRSMACLDESHRKRIKQALDGAFGIRFKKAILYGSEAKGTASPDSDVDILLVLEGPIDLGRDLGTAIEALYPLQLEILRPIHLTPVDEMLFSKAIFAIHRNALAEGITL